MQHLDRDFLTGIVSPDTESMPAINPPDFVSGHICAEVNALINFNPLNARGNSSRPARRPSMWVDTVQTDGPARVKMIVPSPKSGHLLVTCITRKEVLELELPAKYPFKFFIHLNLGV